MSAHRLLLATGLTGLLLLGACSGDEATPGAQPTGISIAPSTETPQDLPTSAAPSGPASSQAPSAEPGTGRLDASAAVAAAEAAVADSSAIEISEDDDGNGDWEVTLRAGENGRSLQIGRDGTVVSNRSEQLDADQLGDPPTVPIQRALQTAQKRVPGGVVTDAELTSENNRRVWDVSVDATGDNRELWIDAASGAVVREEKD